MHSIENYLFSGMLFSFHNRVCSFRKKSRSEHGANLDADDPVEDDSDDSSEDEDDEDDTAELMAELQRIKAERAAEMTKKVPN